MAFRDHVVAICARASALDVELRSATLRAERAEAECRRLHRELDEIRRGASREQDLREDVHFNVTQVLLPVASLIGIAWAVVLRVLVFGDLFGDLNPTLFGLRFLLRRLDDSSVLIAVLLVAGSLIIAMLPLIAAFGLARRRRWGWAMSVVSYVPFCVALPPLGMYGLFALCRTRTTAAFFGDRAQPDPAAQP